MDLTFDRSTALSGLAGLVAVAGLLAVGYGQLHVWLIEGAAGAVGGGTESLSASSRARLAHYRAVRTWGVAAIAVAAAAAVFDVLGGTERALALLRRE